MEDYTCVHCGKKFPTQEAAAQHVLDSAECYPEVERKEPPDDSQDEGHPNDDKEVEDLRTDIENRIENQVRRQFGLEPGEYTYYLSSFKPEGLVELPESPTMEVEIGFPNEPDRSDETIQLPKPE